MNDIFVSYRRTDSSDVTGRIFDHLKSAFGEKHLFKDVEKIPLGMDYRDAIARGVRNCDVLLVIIGKHWLETVDESGKRRIDQPDDSVHLEIASALDRSIPVIPVLTQGATIPKSDDLPEDLKPLVFRNAARVRTDPDFHHDIRALCVQLRRYLGDSSPVETSPEFEPADLSAARARNPGNRSVSIGGNATGNVIQTGDHNIASLEFTETSIPDPAEIDIESEFSALCRILSGIQTSDQNKINRALEDVREELAKPSPDRDEVGDALERALNYARKAERFGTVAKGLPAHLSNTVSWLGSDWYKLLEG